MSIEEKREHSRRAFVKHIRYSLTVTHKGAFEEFNNDGVSVDISEGGLGMITDYFLKTGDILFFEHGIKVNKNIIVKTSIVKWAREIEKRRYRVGLKFFAYINSNYILYFINNL